LSRFIASSSIRCMYDRLGVVYHQHGASRSKLDADPWCRC
jgi:hypothetical protein